VKGRFGLDFVQHPNRLTTPLIRKNGELKEASWDEAYEFIAKKLASIKKNTALTVSRVFPPPGLLTKRIISSRNL